MKLVSQSEIGTHEWLELYPSPGSSTIIGLIDRSEVCALSTKSFNEIDRSLEYVVPYHWQGRHSITFYSLKLIYGFPELVTHKSTFIRYPSRAGRTLIICPLSKPRRHVCTLSYRVRVDPIQRYDRPRAPLARVSYIEVCSRRIAMWSLRACDGPSLRRPFLPMCVGQRIFPGSLSELGTTLSYLLSFHGSFPSKSLLGRCYSGRLNFELGFADLKVQVEVVRIADKQSSTEPTL